MTFKSLTPRNNPETRINTGSEVVWQLNVSDTSGHCPKSNQKG
jgi:hypothetical protein